VFLQFCDSFQLSEKTDKNSFWSSWLSEDCLSDFLLEENHEFRRKPRRTKAVFNRVFEASWALFASFLARQK
jgi:hypothetical protein